MAVPANQVEEFFGQVFGVVTGALEGLRHEQDAGAVGGDALAAGFEVAVEDGATGGVDFGVELENRLREVEVAGQESLVDLGEHFLKDVGHFDKIVGVFAGEAGGEFLETMGDAPG